MASAHRDYRLPKKPPKNPPIKVLLITSILSMPLSLLPHTLTKEESDKP